MTAQSSFAINARFLSHPMTGVQRYAFNVLSAMDDALETSGGRASLFVPSGVADPGFKRLSLKPVGKLHGHPWEQLMLPLYADGRLLNLGNTAPAIKTEQIVCIHDANVFLAANSYSGAFRAFYRNLLPLVARRSARIATVSHASARQLCRYLPLNERDIAVLPNGHEHAFRWNAERATIAPKLVAEGFGERSDRPFVVALGSAARHKNLELLIDIAPALDDLGINVVIIGGEAGIYRSGILGDRPNVRLAGRVADDEIAYLLDHALCLAFPSLTEGFGLPIVEAMARGCPVVSSDRASMPEVCGTAALLAAPDDPAAWVKHIRNLKESPGLRQEMTGRGRDQVGNFSWTNTAAGYMELLEHPDVKPVAHAPVLPKGLKVAVVIATKGRPATVSATVAHLIETQTLRPAAVIVSCADLADAGSLVNRPDVNVVVGPSGLAAQRNTALKNVPDGMDVIAFFDDDFVADKNWLAAAATAFSEEGDVVGFTGRVIADGIKGPGIPFEEAKRLVAGAPASDWNWIEPFSPYGCNMAFRVGAIGDTRFDERLVLYSWLEDRDFAAALVKKGGRLIKCAAAFGVHMGTKSGRMNGERLGYSQVVNPVYMLRKGTMTYAKVIDHIFCNMAINIARSPVPEPFIDRRGRLKGNLMGWADVLRGRLEPEKAATLSVRNKTLKIQPEVDAR